MIEHKQNVRKHGDDMPAIAGWRWGQQEKAGGSRIRNSAADNL
jgi:xylulose-5-phosphate/fructose-6-phosphate phosphoketolase